MIIIIFMYFVGINMHTGSRAGIPTCKAILSDKFFFNAQIHSTVR